MLVPVVAAMLMLLALGLRLLELSTAQVAHSGTAADGVRAFWVAEAGVHHAVSVGDGASVPVPFAGGEFVVDAEGDEYVAASRYVDSSVRVERTVLVADDDGDDGDDGTLMSPIDVDESLDRAYVVGDRRVDIPLVSVAPYDLLLRTVSLATATPGERLRTLYLDDDRIFRQNAGQPLPTGDLDVSGAQAATRTVPAGGAPVLRLEFRYPPNGTIWYTLVLGFADGSSSTFDFGVAW